MKLAMKALVPTLALVAALSLPSVAEASHRHGPRCGHRGYHSDGYYSDGYSRGSRHGYYSRPYGYSSRYRGYHPRYYGHGYARVPYGYGYGYGYEEGYGYGYYPPPPPYRSHRPRVGVSLYFGF
jgi:hypothetical protein